MFKKILVAAAITLACPALIFAQDINFLFGGTLPEAGAPTPATNAMEVDINNVTSGSVNIYSTSGFNFDALDLDFFSSNTNVAVITGGEGFNPVVGPIGDRFDSSTVTVPTDDGMGNPITPGSTGNLFSVAVLGTGIDAGFAPFDPLFDANTGPAGSAGSFLLARIDYDIVGQGTTDFSFGLGDQGILQLPATPLNPTFGSATLTVGVPEPSSALLLIFGSVGLFARRRRA